MTECVTNKRIRRRKNRSLATAFAVFSVGLINWNSSYINTRLCFATVIKRNTEWITVAIARALKQEKSFSCKIKWNALTNMQVNIKIMKHRTRTTHRWFAIFINTVGLDRFNIGNEIWVSFLGLDLKSRHFASVFRSIISIDSKINYLRFL